jgi:hypothetical protein
VGDGVPDGVPDVVPAPDVAGMYDSYSGSVELRTGSCTSADAPVASSLTLTVTMEPGGPAAGFSIMAGGWAREVSWLALTGIDTFEPVAPVMVTVASVEDVLNTVPMIRPGWSAE